MVYNLYLSGKMTLITQLEEQYVYYCYDSPTSNELVSLVC